MTSFFKNKYAAISVFVILFTITQIAAFQFYKEEKKREVNMVQRESEHVRKKIEAVFSQSNNATSMIALLIQHNLLNNHFEEVAAELIKYSDFFDAIQLIQDMVIVKTYPLKGNEAVIGYDLKTDNGHTTEMMLSATLNSLHFEGPFNLKQGGVGFVGRNPIIQNDTLWGYAAVIIKKDKFIRLLGLDSTGKNDNFIYQLKKQQEGKRYIPLFSSSRTDFTEGIVQEQYIPIGDWIIQVKLTNPLYRIRYIWISMIGLVLSLVFSLFIHYKSLRLK